MCTCIFGHGWDNLPVQFPDSVGTTLQRFLGFVFFWLLTLPVCSMRPNQLKWLYNFKAWTLPPSVIGLLIYCLVQSKGKLASTAELSAGVPLPTGATLGWLFMTSVNSSMGNWSTFIANMPDFSRYATGPKAVFWTHVLFVPIPAALGGMIGIFGTSAIQQAWGVTLWNQWDLYDEMLSRSFTGPMRLFVCLLAFCSALFLYGSIIGANLLPFGSDVTAVFPVYFNIPRGMYFCCIVGLALNPWKILASANGFLAFLGGYGIFMGPAAAIMISDYWIVRRGNIVIEDAYSSAPGSTYMYYKGFNINAVIAYVSGMIIPFTGFIGTFGVKVPAVATKLDSLGWLISFGVALTLYVALSFIHPLSNVDKSWKFEQLAYSTLDSELTVEEIRVNNEDIGKEKAGSSSETLSPIILEI
jgi:nucleobase:cation symporter-1, NCS1 family